VLRPLAALAVAAVLAAGCSSTTEGEASPPTSVADAETSGEGVSATLRVGTVINTSAPTADADTRTVSILQAAVDLLEPETAVTIESVQIRDVDDVEPAIQALRELGVTVIVTLCDDATVPALARAGIDAELLVVSGCVSLPRPALSQTSRFFIDAAALHDAPEAVAGWIPTVSVVDSPDIGVLRSDLIPDVDGTCASIVQLVGSTAVGSIGLDLTFTSLVDDAEIVANSVVGRESALDALVLCALPPFAGELVDTLRSAGFAGPIVTPWFVDGEQWPASTNDVYVVSPASRHGDDPASAVAELYELIDDPRGVDVVAADTMALLIRAVERTGSAAPERIATFIRSGPVEVFSGTIAVAEAEAHIERTYRSITIADGIAAFDSEIGS